jgi:hypothetical protein
MSTKRIAEIRMLVIVLIDVASEEFGEAVKAMAKNPSAVAEVVASEVVSNLESVPYIESAIVSHL